MKHDFTERCAFLYLCGIRDRELLTGKREMTFSDFDRLTYLTDFFGFGYYNMEIWNRFAGNFQTELQEEEYNCLDDKKDVWKKDEMLQKKWVLEFYEGISDVQAKKELKKYMDE